MMDSQVVSDALRQRLQLVLGVRAALGEEVAGMPDQRTFLAVAGEIPVTVTVHPAPPRGPDADAMRRRGCQLRELEHDLVDVPLAEGEFDGRVWIMTVVPALPSASARLASGPLPLVLGVSLIRDLARGVAAMHRRGITHGAIDLDTVRIGGATLRLGGAGARADASVREDLDAVGAVAWALLSGERVRQSARPLSAIRRGVRPSLDAVCAALCAADPRDRPESAAAILEALDAVPTPRTGASASIVDAGFSDGRPRRAVAWLVVGGALLLLLVLLQLRG